MSIIVCGWANCRMGPHIFFGPMLVLFDFGLKTQVLEFGKVTDLAQKDWEVGLGNMPNVY